MIVGRLVLVYVDGRVWEVAGKGFLYVTEDGDPIQIEVGFKTDFASIPRFFWRVLPPMGDGPKGAYGPATVIHDALYQRGEVQGRPITRAYADGVLDEICKELGVSAWRRFLIRSGLRIGGWVVWRRYRKKR